MSGENKICKVTVLLDAPLFQRLDRYCRESAYKKSTLIARLVREHLKRENFEVGPAIPKGALGARSKR